MSAEVLVKKKEGLIQHGQNAHNMIDFRAGFKQ